MLLSDSVGLQVFTDGKLINSPMWCYKDLYISSLMDSESDYWVVFRIPRCHISLWSACSLMSSLSTLTWICSKSHFWDILLTCTSFDGFIWGNIKLNTWASLRSVWDIICKLKYCENVNILTIFTHQHVRVNFRTCEHVQCYNLRRYLLNRESAIWRRI